jgi:coniferyl-aldehyde dehydrogenase
MPDTNMQTATGSIDAMQAIFHQQKAAFEAERHRPLSDRKADLEKIEELVKTRGDEFAAAIDADFGRRSKSETALAELGFTIATAKHSRQHLTKWASSKPVSVPMTLAPGKAYVRREPKGVVGIVSPWNYSMQLAFAPLVAALAAGCRVMVKPSEFTPRTAALIKSTLGELFSEDHVAVI